VERRFDIRVENEHDVYIDDYAHHPKEIAATIRAVRELYPGRSITGIFQPHLFSRTRDHAAEFALSLDELDEVILMPVYPAREQPIPGVSSANILDKLKTESKKLLGPEALLSYLAKAELQVLVTLGAGDIGLLANDIETLLKQR
jgi:UDP-N-acetylmuramate--alanine ligase